MKYGAWLRLVLCVVPVVWAGGCAASPPPNPAGPRSNEPPYPVLMVEDEERRETALGDWATLTRDQGMMNAPAPDLQPVTATIRSIPTTLSAPLYLPKVGEGTPMTEEETRESLRRFIVFARNLIGAEPRQLSLVLRTDLADGTKKAEYRQRPFRLPIRGDYGVLEITFRADRRILQVTSTCIPEVDQLQRAGAGIRPVVTADKVPEHLLGKTFTYTDAGGTLQTYTITSGDSITTRELVVYPHPRAADPSVLEFHLAWEVLVGSNPVRVVYLDAITDQVIAATQFSGA